MTQEHETIRIPEISPETLNERAARIVQITKDNGEVRCVAYPEDLVGSSLITGMYQRMGKEAPDLELV